MDVYSSSAIAINAASALPRVLASMCPQPPISPSAATLALRRASRTVAAHRHHRVGAMIVARVRTHRGGGGLCHARAPCMRVPSSSSRCTCLARPVADRVRSRRLRGCPLTTATAAERERESLSRRDPSMPSTRRPTTTVAGRRSSSSSSPAAPAALARAGSGCLCTVCKGAAPLAGQRRHNSKCAGAGAALQHTRTWSDASPSRRARRSARARVPFSRRRTRPRTHNADAARRTRCIHLG
eukprot:scaffold4409_cov369-Prasinococcus_capsulatus_cf.AAC.8